MPLVHLHMVFCFFSSSWMLTFFFPLFWTLSPLLLLFFFPRLLLLSFLFLFLFLFFWFTRQASSYVHCSYSFFFFLFLYFLLCFYFYFFWVTFLVLIGIIFNKGIWVNSYNLTFSIFSLFHFQPNKKKKN